MYPRLVTSALAGRFLPFNGRSGRVPTSVVARDARGQNFFTVALSPRRLKRIAPFSGTKDNLGQEVALAIFMEKQLRRLPLALVRMRREDEFVCLRVPDASNLQNVVALADWPDLVFTCWISLIANLEVEFDVRSHGFASLSGNVSC